MKPPRKEPRPQLWDSQEAEWALAARTADANGAGLLAFLRLVSESVSLGGGLLGRRDRSASCA
ncbi:hypothetical protein BCD49_24395 [Pseudofrankia sp. EUN1h]|nr:hypothetical protein BCD49_24395 [Pseudofrankia sp. EUN1h]